MNSQLVSALKELVEAGAEGVPEVETIEQAPNDSQWSGSAIGNGYWALIKHQADSYTTNTHR